MDRDLFDVAKEQWSRERPDLDSSGLDVVSRILLLANHLKKRASGRLDKHGLNLWAYDVLATLRRQGPPYQLSPTELSRMALLSPGAMTNRLDRLEESNLIERRPDPNDRRGVLIALTPQGQEVTDEVVTTRFDEASKAMSELTEEERETLSGLLRKLLVSYTMQAKR